MSEDQFLRAKCFLEMKFRTKDFVPALGIKLSTFHEFKYKGFLEFESFGSGKQVLLDGLTVLLARCFALIAISGGSTKIQTKGLSNIVSQKNFGNFVFDSYNLKKEIPNYYIGYRASQPNSLRGRDNSYICKGEWLFLGEKLEDSDIIDYVNSGNNTHFIPFCSVMNLTYILLDLTNKISFKVN